MNATTTKLIAASITSPMLIRASPMSKPMSWKLLSPKMAAMIGLITPVEQGIDDLGEVQRQDQADGDHDDVALVDERLELVQHVLHVTGAPVSIGTRLAGK